VPYHHFLIFFLYFPIDFLKSSKLQNEFKKIQFPAITSASPKAAKNSLLSIPDTAPSKKISIKTILAIQKAAEQIMQKFDRNTKIFHSSLNVIPSFKNIEIEKEKCEHSDNEEHNKSLSEIIISNKHSEHEIEINTPIHNLKNAKMNKEILIRPKTIMHKEEFIKWKNMTTKIDEILNSEYLLKPSASTYDFSSQEILSNKELLYIAKYSHPSFVKKYPKIKQNHLLSVRSLKKF